MISGLFVVYDTWRESQIVTDKSKKMYLNLWLVIFCLLELSSCIDNQDKPVLQELAIPRQLKAGQSVKLHCDLVKGKQPIRFAWRLNEKRIENNDDFLVINKDEETSLKISNLSIGHLGVYSCSSSNEYGEDEKQAKLHFDGDYYLFIPSYFDALFRFKF